MIHACLTFPCPVCHPDQGVQGEVRVTSSTGGQKGMKLARFDLIPAGPLRQLAEHYGKGAQKYADRNWELGTDWHLNFGAMMRHAWAFWEGEDYDAHTPDCAEDCAAHSGSAHLAAVVWHAFALLEFMRTHPELDDRPATAAARERAAGARHLPPDPADGSPTA